MLFNSDIDECERGLHGCVKDTAICTNTIGSYNCSCKTGYLGDGKTSCNASGELCMWYIYFAGKNYL